MSAVVIFGADGLTGSQLVPAAIGSYFVHAVTKTSTNDKILRQEGAEPHVLDLTKASVSDIEKLLKETKAKIVVNASSADSHKDTKDVRAVDYEGALKIIEAMKKAHVKRYIGISAMGVHDPSAMPAYYSDISCLASKYMWSSEMKDFLQAKWDFEKALHETDLDFTMVRPGALFDNVDTGCRYGVVDLIRERATVTPLTTDNVLSAMWPTSRQLVAQTIYACMRNDATIGLTFDVVNSFGDISEELDSIVKTRTDVWIEDLKTREWDEKKAKEESDKIAEIQKEEHPGPKIVWGN